MKNIILISSPAGGKGTQSKLLKDKYNYVHISAGELLRNFSEDDSVNAQQLRNVMQKGDLVPNETTVSLIDDKLKKHKGRPFILDGFPRNVSQAQKFSLILNKNNIEDYIVIYLKLDEKEAENRAINRVSCSCGKIYNLNDETLSPKVEGVCDECSSALSIRTDDNVESFKKRFELYLNNTKDLLEYYRSNNKEIVIINGVDTPMNIFKQIEKVIND